MTKGLILKIAALTAVAGGLVFVNQLVGSTATSMRSPEGVSRAAGVAAQPSMPQTAVAHAPADTPATRAAPLGAMRRRPRELGAAGLNADRPNFVSVCRYSHSNMDDPIVDPGKPGAAHHHDFFANTTTNASSTYDSMRAGGTTCRIQGDTAGYWAPSMWVNGTLVRPTLARIYYLPGRKNHTTVRPLPAGLKVLAKGDNVRVAWSCVGRDQRTKAQATPPTCPANTHLVEHIQFPDCWDGQHLDTPDHMSNMTFARGGGCPQSHPVPVPAISLNIHYPTRGGNVVLGMPDEPVAPHADFFNTWDQLTLDRLVRMCIDAGVHCGARPPGANV